MSFGGKMQQQPWGMSPMMGGFSGSGLPWGMLGGYGGMQGGIGNWLSQIGSGYPTMGQGSSGSLNAPPFIPPVATQPPQPQQQASAPATPPTTASGLFPWLNPQQSQWAQTGLSSGISPNVMQSRLSQGWDPTGGLYNFYNQGDGGH